jgi:hypothetical protein
MRATIGTAVVTALVLSTGSAHAAPKQQIRDAAGDYQVAAADILSGSLAVTGKRTKTLVIRLNLAAAPTTTTPFTYTVTFQAGGDCSFKAIYYGHPLEGTVSTSGVGCKVGSDPLRTGDVVVDGASVVWSVPLSPPLKLRQRVTTLAARTEPGGFVSGPFSPPLADAASGTDWVIG